MACSHGNSFVVQTLLRGGAVKSFSLLCFNSCSLIFKDLHQQDVNGWTPALTATFHGRLGCLQLLVKWGAKLDEVDNDGNTAGETLIDFTISSHASLSLAFQLI